VRGEDRRLLAVRAPDHSTSRDSAQQGHVLGAVKQLAIAHPPRRVFRTHVRILTALCAIVIVAGPVRRVAGQHGGAWLLIRISSRI
jgi:hypothetical protein